MQLVDALKLVKRIITTGEINGDQNRTVEMADKYRKLITGDDIGSLLVQFVQREDATLFAQRLLLTKAITPAVAASIRKPFNKVIRNDRVRKSFNMGAPEKDLIVGKMISSFFGAARKQNRGLEYWMKTRFLELQFTDPNAWLVLEWNTPENAAEVITPRPFEVSSSMAKNWLIINDEVKWLQICQSIKFQVKGTDPNAEESSKDGQRLTLYDEDITVVFEECDPNYLNFIGYVLGKNQLIEKVNNRDYLISSYTPNIGYVPAFRIGYNRDEVTNGRTFVNPWHDALCYFEKSLKTVSEMDLTMALHVFPQKLQYVHKCQGEVKNNKNVGCNKGRSSAGGVCGACKGAGYQIHTTAADAILLPMPESKDEMMNLDQMLVYKAPPIETVKFQNEYILQLEKQSHQAVFNSQVFIKKTANAEGGGDPMQTATEADYNMQSVYDALEPFSEKYSELWQDLVATFGIISGVEAEKITTVHVFPADPKLKNSDILISERRTASVSGAPSFMIETIDDDLADVLYAGDDLKLGKYRVKKRYAPFPGKSADEIALMIASEYVPKGLKILYLNFDQIFKELEMSNPEIWTGADIKKVDALVAAKVVEFTLKVDADKPEPFNINSFRNSNPAGGDGEQPDGEGNPGDDDGTGATA